MRSVLALVMPTWPGRVQWRMYLYLMFYKRAGVGGNVSNVHLSQLPIIEPDIRSETVGRCNKFFTAPVEWPLCDVYLPVICRACRI